MLKKIYVNVRLFEALKEAPSYLNFLRELLSKKDKLEEVSMALMGEVCSVVRQSKVPSRLQDPDSFFIPCPIGDL